MTIEQRIEHAVRSADPVATLRALVGELARVGIAKSAIVKVLEDFVVDHRERPGFSEGDQEPVFEVLDALAGDCHPAVALLPQGEWCDHKRHMGIA